MAPGQRRNPEATRERILRSAEREFAGRGFQGARLRQIAVGARTSVPLVIHHFSDKQGLYQAVVERLVTKVSAVGQRAAESTAADLSSLLDGMRALAQLHPDEIILLHQVLRGGAGSLEASLRPLRDVREQVVRQLRRAKRAGGLPRAVEPVLLAIALVGALLYPVLAAPAIHAVWNRDPAPRQWRNRLAAQVALLLEGLVALGDAGKTLDRRRAAPGTGRRRPAYVPHASASPGRRRRPR